MFDSSTVVVAGAAMVPEVERRLASYRYDVFVKRLGWQIPSSGAEPETERDQFDNDDTVYVIRQDATGTICGCARLLPTDQPYLLQEVFPNLFSTDDLPKSHLIWEMSRLAVSDGGTPGQKSSAIDGLRAVLKAAVEFGLERGIERYISVSYVSMERLLRRMGLHTHRAGIPALIDGQLVVAFWVDLDAVTIQALGCYRPDSAAH